MKLGIGSDLLSDVTRTISGYVYIYTRLLEDSKGKQLIKQL